MNATVFSISFFLCIATTTGAWAMKADTPKQACMFGDKYVFEQWDCPDTI